jgi:hypothetical protein
MQKVRRSPEELKMAVQQLESLGYRVTDDWKRGLTALEGLDVLVSGSLGTATYYAASLFDWAEISHTRDRVEGVVQYKGSPLLLTFWKDKSGKEKRE